MAFSDPFPPAPDPSDEAAFEAHLQELIAALPAPLLNNLHILLTGCVQATLALWREPGVTPEMIAEAEELSGLTEAHVRALSQVQGPQGVGRVLLTAPVRLHALTALGLALLDTPLLDRFTKFMERPSADFAPGTWPRIRAAAHDIGTKLMRQFEERTDGALYDVEDLLAERRGDLPDAPRYGGEELRLRRLQLEGFVARTLADYVPPFTAADDDDDRDGQHDAHNDHAAAPRPNPAQLLAPDAPETASDGFTRPFMTTSFLESQLAMMQLALRLPLALHLLPDHRFGEAARTLRWLRHRPALETLLLRLENLAPETKIEFSAAELIRLYQATQFTALALVGDVMNDLDEFLHRPNATPINLSAFFNTAPDADGESPRRAVFGMVEGFVEMVRNVVASAQRPAHATPEHTALQVAQEEIDGLSSLL